MTRSIRWVLTAAVLAGSTCFWAYSLHKSPIQYQTAAVERGDIRSVVSATGNCSAVVTVQVGSQVSGNIKSLMADFNSTVKRGDLVALIDPEPFTARVNQAQAALENAQASVVTAKANAAKVNADVATAKAQRENAKADVAKTKVAENDARVKLERRQQMAKQLLIAREELDTAQASYDAAVAARQAAESQLAGAEASIHSVEGQYQVALAQVEAANAQVRQARAALEQAQLDLSHTRIIAPVDGVVISRNVDVGQTVAASFQAPVIFVIAQDLTQMQVDTSVDEADIGRVRPDAQATFTVDAYPGQVFQASVHQIRKAPITAQNVVTYDVVLAVNNSELKLFPGMTANVRILVEQHSQVLKVPNAALRFRPASTTADTPARKGGKRTQTSQTIYLASAQGPVSVKVQVGLSDGISTEVAANEIKEGDRVVIAAPGAVAQTTAAQAPRRGPSF